MKFEIFKTGTHTSDKGISKEYSLEDLNFIAQSYKPEEDEAPIVIGHPEDNDPAFGWVNSLSVSEDGKLIAETSDENLQPDFLNALKEGRYKKRSISLTPEGKLRHIGFLGAAKPSVKGLADIQFSSPSSVVYEFDLSKEPEVKPEVDKISELSQEINHLKETVASLQQNFSESGGNSAKDSIDKINSQLNSLQAKISNSDFENLLDDKVEEGTLTPAIKDKVLELSNFMQVQNFSDDFSPSKFQGEVNKLLITLVNSFPKIIYYDNFAEKPEDDNSLKDDSFIGMEIDAESKQLHKKALGLMKKENISYLSAVTKLIHN